MEKWLQDAVFYQVYPQSFYDSNADGIGDIPGVIEKLDYIQDLGCNAIWLNPCFDSPFKDAGYDVRDYTQVAERYGTNEDLETLIVQAHKRNIKVLLDLVPGHTSEEHDWFDKSSQVEENAFSDRYIWTTNPFCGSDGVPFISGEVPRNASYILNYFKCQPALNYGYRNITQPWQQPIDAPGPILTREAMKEIMRFWLKKGCDGFRVDMAHSLVKNDPNCEGTKEVWRDISGSVKAEYPHMVLLSEWDNPRDSLDCGFDMDFYLDWSKKGMYSMLRDYPYEKDGDLSGEDNSYFKKESSRDVSCFLESYLGTYEVTKDKGLWCMMTCTHDGVRLAPKLSDRERRLAFAFLFTMPGAPFLYYGDEIGMRYRNVPTKEGGYHRTGSRTPMQWDKQKNLGFSTAEAAHLYLPVDPAVDAPTVQAQQQDPDSLLNFVKKLLSLRHSYEALQNCSPFTVFSAEPGSRLFAYKRADMLVAINPGEATVELPLDGKYTVDFQLGTGTIDGMLLRLEAQSFVLLKPKS